MTPEQARKRWCPMARVEAMPREDISATVNRNGLDGKPYEGSHCIATDCAWWHSYQRVVRSKADDLGREVPEYEEHGYCGAAPVKGTLI